MVGAIGEVVFKKRGFRDDVEVKEKPKKWPSLRYLAEREDGH